MAQPHTPSGFTGRHMAAILIVGFGIVAAVNFTMASYAAGGFHGIVVENSYVASQKFNGWLEEAEASRALGWEASIEREQSGHLILMTNAVPQSAIVTAQLRRPIGKREQADLTFTALEDGRFRSTAPVSDGRWTVRVFIEAGAHRWAQESEIP